MVQLQANALQYPNIDVMGAFGRGVEGAQNAAITQSNLETSKLQRVRANLEEIGSLALGVMDGKLDGNPDPQRWEHALDAVEAAGLNVGHFRGHPDLAPVVARASMDTLGQLNNARSEQEMSLRVREFEGRLVAEATSRAAAKQERAATENYLRQHDPDLADQFAAGLLRPEDAHAALERRINPTGKDAPELVEIFDADTGQPQKGYFRGDQFIPVGGHKAATGGNRPDLSATEVKELFDAQDALTAGTAASDALGRAIELNKSAWDGPFAEQRGYGASMVGVKEGGDTLELKNLVTAQALDQLKTTFGSMPTEGERKILLEVQGSVDQPRDVRDRIYKRAQVAVDRRNAENRRKADAIRTRDYQKPGFDPTATGGASDVAEPTTDAEFNALPSGATYRDPDDGQLYRKP